MNLASGAPRRPQVPGQSRNNHTLCAIASLLVGIVSFLVGLVTIIVINFIGTTILFVSTGDSGQNGWNEIADYCDPILRNTMLTVIIGQFLIVGYAIYLGYKERYIIAGTLSLIPFIILGCILSALYSTSMDMSGVCATYLTIHQGFASPGNVFIYQMAVCWSSALLGVGFILWTFLE
jgi:hypothetical protein